jgi:hypothetical protein
MGDPVFTYWYYLPKIKKLPAGAVVEAIAKDLPGNEGRKRVDDGIMG